MTKKQFTKKELLALLSCVTKRMTGKTTLLQNGVQSYSKPFLFVCSTVARGKHETNNNQNAIYLTPNTVNNFYGRDLPIMLSHDVLAEIIDKAHSFEVYKEIHNSKAL